MDAHAVGKSERPQITSYQDPVRFLRDMIEYRRRTEASFSVLMETRRLRKVSPTLVSLILKGQRRLNSDRADEFAKLLGLTSSEKAYFRDWLLRNEGHGGEERSPGSPAPSASGLRKQVSIHILSDWLNLFVKDCFQLAEVRENPELIYPALGHVATRKRIDRSLQFLLREGHLRRTPEGRMVVEVPLTVTDPQLPHRKIRDFHRAALKNAREALEAFPPSERFANAMTLPLDRQSYEELLELVKEFGLKLQDFAARQPAEARGMRLYQFVLNLSPVGGKIK